MIKRKNSPLLTFLLLTAAGVCLGLLSLWFAAGEYYIPMFLSYLKDPVLAVLNLAPAVMLVWFLYCLAGRAWLAFFLSSALVITFTWASLFKVLYRDDPLLFEDLLLMREAENMAGKYQPFLNESMVAAIILVLAGTAALWLLAGARPAGWTRLGGIAALIMLLIPLKTGLLDEEIYNNRILNYELINRWSATQVYLSKGFIYPFLHSVSYAIDEPPENYDRDRAESMLSAWPETDIPEDRKVNVIAIMLEAYNDFSKFDVPGLSGSVYEAYHELEAEGYSGNLLVNIFAGGTVDTERAFITGLSTLGTFRSPTNSYAWYLKEQGYAVTGSHPSYQWFYNRLNVNANLGYDKYLYLENHYRELTGDGIVYDDVFFPELIRLFEENLATGKPLFSFSVTYQGHGPYDDQEARWGEDFVTGGAYTRAEQNILNNYFGSIANTNKNLAYLTDYLRTSEEPVVLVIFGDHNPWLGDGNSVYNTLGINLDLADEEGFYNYFSTRYLIWANAAAKEATGCAFTGAGEDISPCFLMDEVFSQCGWDGPAFMQSSRVLKKRVPVVNSAGLYVEDGELANMLTPEGAALLEDYYILQYYWRRNFVYE